MILIGIVVVIILFIFSMSMFGFGESKGSGVVRLGGSEFVDTFKKTDEAVLLDVRTPGEFADGHIEGAINVDYSDPSFVSEIKKLDTSKTYFVYCRSGNRSGSAAALMSEHGFTSVFDMQGGIMSAPQLVR